MTLAESLVEKVKQLSTAEQIEVEHFIETIRRKRSEQKPAGSPEGLLADPPFDLSLEDFKQARREMWRKEPRDFPE